MSIAMVELICKNPNEPIVLTKDRLKEILKEVLKNRFLLKMSEVDLIVLKKILEEKETTNQDLAKALGKRKQNISKNLKKLRRIKAIKVKKIG